MPRRKIKNVLLILALYLCVCIYQFSRLNQLQLILLEFCTSQIQKMNDIIRTLTGDTEQIEKYSLDQNRKTKSEAEKQEAADMKNSDGKKAKLMQELNQLKTQLQNLIAEHRENETALRQVINICRPRVSLLIMGNK